VEDFSMRIQDFNKTHGSLLSISMRKKHWMRILPKFRTKEAEIKRDLIIISIDVNIYYCYKFITLNESIFWHVLLLSEAQPDL
jgi:hypothetical protein